MRVKKHAVQTLLCGVFYFSTFYMKIVSQTYTTVFAVQRTCRWIMNSLHKTWKLQAAEDRKEHEIKM